MAKLPHNRRAKGLQLYQPTTAFEGVARAACFSISAAKHTQEAYWADFRHWMAFCQSQSLNPIDPPDEAVSAWVQSMTNNSVAPKTRARRIAGLCSIYRHLRRARGDGKRSAVTRNPFSIEEGPTRDKNVQAVEPTSIASPESIKALLATCDETPIGIRDTALIRVMWATGARRASVIGMTLERVRKDRGDYVATLLGKGGKELRVLIRGKAAHAFARWLEVLKEGGFLKGPVWRTKTGVLTEKQLWQMLRRRGKVAKISPPVSPHMFRVAFLTYNPASLESKQDAAGHADVNTTRLYDRTSWRGREAFEKMPEIEDTDE